MLKKISKHRALTKLKNQLKMIYAMGI